MRASRIPALLLIALAELTQPTPGSAATDLLSVSELAGVRWNEMGNGDGVGTDAKFIWPTGIAVNSMGIIFVSDASASTIRKITPDGTVTTIAGQGQFHGVTDGPGPTARFTYPRALAFDAHDNLYVTEEGNHTVRKISTNGIVSTVAGLARTSGSQIGTGSVARFNLPRGITLDAAGNLFVSDQGNARIRKINPLGVVTNFGNAGQGAEGSDFDASGNLVVADWQSSQLFKFSPNGTRSLFSGQFSDAIFPRHQDGPSNTAFFAHPTDVAVAPDGFIYVTEARGHTIRKVGPDGYVTTFAGFPLTTGTNDGIGSAARFSGPRALAFLANGDLVVADSDNSMIRKVTPDGTVTTIAGTAGRIGPVP